MKKLAMVLLCSLLTIMALAQPPANLLSMARAELEKRGLNEAEVRTRLLEEGIDVDAIQPADYPHYQGRVMSILNAMQAEKNKTNTATQGNAGGGEITVNQNGEISVGEAEATQGTVEAPVVAPTVSSSDIAQTTMGEAAAEQALEENLKENHVSPTEGDNIYGHSLYTGKSLDVFRTTDGAQAPDTYILGSGDEVHISIFGSSQTEIHQRISPDGSIQPAGSTKIFLKGMTLAQGRAAIRSRLASYYSFRPDQIAVTLTTARTVTASIYGEVGVPGGFTLSALNTVFNALAAAGGPTRIGSVRNIQLNRSGKTHTLDLYAYMTNPASGFDYDLLNGDVIFVPVANKIVRIEGAVNRSMSYELLEKETLKDLIELAGGLTYNAHPEFVQIERFKEGEKQYLEYDLAKVMDGSEVIKLENADVVRVRTANEPLETYVAIEGDVYYPGRFDLDKNHSLKALLDNAKPTYTARTDYVLIERTHEDRTTEVLTVPFPGNGNPDFKLEARDAVRVLDKASYRDVGSITVTGDVRNPFTRSFGIDDVMTLSQAIEYAGGPRYTARKDYVFVERYRPDDTMEILTVPFPGENGNPDFQLQARDVIRVLALADYRDTGTITVSGQVRSPFTRTFGLNDRMTISQAIEYAGGLKATVFPVAYIFRQDITNPEKMKYIRVDLTQDGDIYLEPGDRLNVYDNTTYTNIGEIRVSGAVNNTVHTPFDESLTVHDLLEMAGGFTLGAAYDRVEVFRVDLDNRKEVVHKQITLAVDKEYNLLDSSFQLQPYDHIVVRMTPNFSLGRTVEVNGRVKYPGVYVLEDSRTQLSQVIKMAGGLLGDADPYTYLFRTYKGRGNIAVDLDRMLTHKRQIDSDPILMEGDVINIVRQENTVVIRETGTRMAQYVPDEFASTQKTVIYQGPRSAKWYIKNFAGGFVRDADRNSVTVTLPNNQSIGTKHFLWWRVYPKVEPGSVITLSIDYRKREKLEKPKEKVDWERIAASTLSALTSITSMILLIERLN